MRVELLMGTKVFTEQHDKEELRSFSEPFKQPFKQPFIRVRLAVEIWDLKHSHAVVLCLEGFVWGSAKNMSRSYGISCNKVHEG